jgi:hypothetical protein
MDLTMLERVGDRYEKMEGSCSTGQSPQWAVVPVEEEGFLQKVMTPVPPLFASPYKKKTTKSLRGNDQSPCSPVMVNYCITKYTIDKTDDTKIQLNNLRTKQRPYCYSHPKVFLEFRNSQQHLNCCCVTIPSRIVPTASNKSTCSDIYV